MASSRLDFRGHHFHLAYHIAGATASMVRGELEGHEAADLWTEEDFLACVAQPQRKSLVHGVIEAAIGSEVLGDPCSLLSTNDGKRFINQLYAAYGPSLTIPSPLEETDAVVDVLEKDFVVLGASLAEDVFSLLFIDRVTLWHFQMYVSERIKKLDANQHHSLLKSEGVLLRAAIPSWLRSAIHHRDHNRCAICRTDLSGSVAVPEESPHLDHMIPLERGGSNDTTNFQLTCGPCNKKKRTQNLQPSPFRIPYF